MIFSIEWKHKGDKEFSLTTVPGINEDNAIYNLKYKLAIYNQSCEDLVIGSIKKAEAESIMMEHALNQQRINRIKTEENKEVSAKLLGYDPVEEELLEINAIILNPASFLSMDGENLEPYILDKHNDVHYLKDIQLFLSTRYEGGQRQVGLIKDLGYIKIED